MGYLIALRCIDFWSVKSKLIDSNILPQNVVLFLNILYSFSHRYFLSFCLSHVSLTEGQKVVVKDGLLNFSDFKKEHVISINDMEDVQVCINNFTQFLPLERNISHQLYITPVFKRAIQFHDKS